MTKTIYEIIGLVIYRVYLYLKHLYGFHTKNCLIYRHVMKNGFELFSKDEKSQEVVCLITKRKIGSINE